MNASAAPIRAKAAVETKSWAVLTSTSFPTNTMLEVTEERLPASFEKAA